MPQADPSCFGAISVDLATCSRLKMTNHDARNRPWKILTKSSKAPQSDFPARNHPSAISLAANDIPRLVHVGFKKNYPGRLPG